MVVQAHWYDYTVTGDVVAGCEGDGSVPGGLRMMYEISGMQAVDPDGERLTLKGAIARACEDVLIDAFLEDA